MKKVFYSSLILIAAICVNPFFLSAQDNTMIHTHIAAPPYPVDTWYLVNDGLAPCATNNSTPNGLYDVATHGVIDVKQWSHRRGEMYAEIDMPGCSAGWYRHDTVINRWMRVADAFDVAYGRTGNFTTNGQNIFGLSDGRVYQMIEFNEYATYPTGWKEISASKISMEQIWSAGCEPGGHTDVFRRGARAGAPEAIGDTIFVPFLSGGGCTTENKIGKFSVVSGTWSFLTLSGMPWDLYPSNGALTFNENYLRADMLFTFPIAGRFQIFMKIEQPYNFGMGNVDSMLAVPSVMWAYDYGEPDPLKKWKNISEGPDHNNATPSANPYNSQSMPGFPHRPRPNPLCINADKTPISTPGNADPCKTHNNWANPAIHSSFDKTRLYCTTGSAVNGGIYYWNGNGWVQQVSDISGTIRPTNNGIFYKISRYSNNQFFWMDGPNSMQVGQINVFCGTDGLTDAGFMTPDDGKTWYLTYVSSTAGCSTPINVGGMYRLKFSSVDKPAATRNLHLNTGTYMGASGENVAVGSGVGGDYQVVVGMNTNAGTITSNGPFAEVNLPGANSLSPGKIVFSNFRGDSIIRVVNVGNRLDEIEVQDVAPFRIAVTGDFGVKVLDSTGMNIIWQHNLAGIGLPSSGLYHVDISNSGQVVVARHGANFSGRARVFGPDGTLFAGILNPGRKILTDVTIKNDTVAVVGENGGTMQNWCGPCGDYADATANGAGCPTMGSKQWPIRIPYVFLYAISGSSVNTTAYTKTYDFIDNELQPDAADAKIAGANFGKDGELYILGEHAGPNSVLRWNGKTNYRDWYNQTGSCGPPTPLQRVDNYSSFSVVLNPIVHIGFVGRVNPATGVVENGTVLYGRNSAGRAATLRLRKINTDAKGYIYVGGTAAARTKGRDLVNINGNLVGPYSGDINFLMLSPDFKTRMFWGPFNATGSIASGSFAGVGMRDNIVAITMNTNRGNLTTTGNAIISQAFSPTNEALNDAYLGVFYQDLWNHSKKDSVQDKLWEADTLVNPEELTWKAQFEVDKRQVCINTPVTFINTSLGDSLQSWEFGDGASLLPGTVGKGPFSVSYSTVGFKTPRLNVILKNGLGTYAVKDEYIQVLPGNVVLTGAITGPVNVCPGSEAVYSVPITPGVTYYDWTFPAGTQIRYGAGGSSVRVVVGNTGGTITVKGQYACGETQTLSLNVNTAVKSDNNVIIVGKENTPNTVMTFDGTGDYFESAQNPVPTVAIDSSGAGKDATVNTGVTLTRSGSSIRSGVALFTANTGYMNVSGTGVLSTNAAQAHTIAGWIKPSVVTGSSRMIFTQKNNASGTNNTDTDFSLIINTSGQLAAHIGRAGTSHGNQIAAGGTITANEWQHVAFVKEGTGAGQAKLYINGLEVATGTHAIGFKNIASMIGNGANGGSPSNSMLGEMDALAVWNTALSPAEVAALAGQTVAVNKTAYPQHTSLIAEWDFNEFRGFTGVSGQAVSTAVSVEFWMKMPSTASLPATVVSWGSANNAEFDVLIDADGLIRIERGTEWYKANFPVNDGQWHHVAISIQQGASAGTGVATNPSVFIDGLLRTRNDRYSDGGSHQNVDAGAPVRIGITSRNLSRPFTGEIDDLRIWDAELNITEVNDYLGTTNLLSHPKYAHLQYHLHNDPVGAVIATDFSSNAYQTNRQGNATWTSDPAYQADLALKTKLEGKGFTVEILKAGEISSNGNEANCAGLVYVSSTVVQVALGQKLLNVPVPMIVAQPRSYNGLAMTSADAGNFGGFSSSATQVTVNDITEFSVLGANIPGPAGNKDVYTSSGEVFWGRPLPGAIAVAHTTGDVFNKTMFGYETGTLLFGNQPAPARRVGFFLNTYDLAKLKPQYGDSLFNRAICWALNNCPYPNSITTGVVSPAVYCPGDTITVPFTTTGTFALTGVVSELPNNVITLDAGSAGSGANQSPQVTFSSTAPAITGGNGSINGDYYWFNQGAAPASTSASLSWTPNISYAGIYKIHYNVPNDPNSLNTAATIRLARPDTSNLDIVFNMQSGKGGEVDLGNYRLPQGSASSLRILNSGTSGTRIVADAVRFTLISLTNPEGNDFSVQLSDKDGSFASATTIGVLPNNNSALSIKGVLPVFIPFGNNYRVRVLSNAPPVVGEPTQTFITVNPNSPEPTGPIIGNTIACAGATIQGYKVVPNPTGATGYLWQIPLGAQFIGPNDRDTVTVQFTTATTNDISVRKVGPCGNSAEQTLKITLAAGPPAQPSAIAGRAIVCNSLTSEIYTIAPVTGASSYTWTIPAGATVSGSVTGNSITVNYAAAAQGVGKVTVKAVNDCGESTARELDVVIDNAATLPVAGAISGVGTLCPNTPGILYSVPPVAGATNYLWTVSGTGASIDTVTPANKNQVRLSVGATNATLSVQITDACGVSLPSSRTITVGPSPDKRALLITDRGVAPTVNAADLATTNRLISMGYSVDYGTSAYIINEATYCYNLIVLSTGIYDNNNQGNNSLGNIDTDGSGAWVGDDDSKRFKALPVPMMVNNAYTWNLTGLSERYRGSGGRVINNRINLVNVTHPIGSTSAPAGNKTVVTGSTRYSSVPVASVPAGATVIARDTVDNEAVVWAIENGGALFGPGVTVAPARRVAFLALGNSDKDNNNDFANLLTGTGITLFERSVCWLTNTCDPISINLTDVNKTVFCAGEQISATFNATGAIGAGNVFELQISNAAGTFGAPATVVGTLTSNTPGIKTITANLPLTLTTGNAYAIRIRSTNTVALSNSITNLNITQVPAKAGAISGTADVCPGQTNIAYSVSPVAGADTYTWTLPVGASIGSGQGTNSIVANMSGASSGSVSVTTSTGGCTNTDAQILPLNFTSGNNWTGAVSTEWHNPANWSCGYLPTATSDVTISNVPSNRYPVVSVAGAVARNLTINGSGASVSITGGTLSLGGNLTRTDGAFTHTAGTLIMNGTTAQTINMGTATTFANLTVNNAAGVSLGGTTHSTINGTLNFVNGRFNIGSSNLILGNASNILGAGSTRYIVVPNDVNAANYVQKQLLTGGLEMTFPIGNATSYNPVSIVNSGAASDVRVRTFAGVYANGNSGALETEKAVNRTWSVVPVNPAANLSIKFQWSNSEHLPSFLSQFAIVRTNPGAGVWDVHKPQVDATGSGVLNMSVSGVTGASKPFFSIVSTNVDIDPILDSTVVLVVGSISGGSLNMTKADSLIEDSLKTRGFKVTVLSDLEEAPSNVNNSLFIWIATSVDNSKLGTKYRNVVRPVVVNAPVLSNMGLALGTSGSFGNPGTGFRIRNEVHPLYKGVTALGTINNNIIMHTANLDFLRTNSAAAYTSGIAYDSSGNGNSAGMTFGANISSAEFTGFWNTSEASPRNTALEFTNGRMLISNGYNGPTGTSARSFSGWIKTTGTNGTVVSWGKSNADAAKSITFRVNASGRMQLDFGTGQSVEATGTTVNTGAWHHVAFTMAGGATPDVGVKIFVNGNEQSVTRTGTAIINLNENLQNVRYGRNVTAANSSAQFIGLMDDVALWNVELTPAEVLATKNNTQSTPVHKSVYPQQAGLQQELDFIKVRDAAAIPIADRVNIGEGMSFINFAAFEAGKDLWSMQAPGKRVVFPYSSASYTDAGGINANATTQASFKNILDNTLCWILNSCATMIEINTATVPTSAVCQGDTVLVGFKTVNSFNPGNIFTVELSNASGSFASPVNIGTFASTVPSILPIKAAIPAGTPPGTGYRVRVISSNPVAVILTDNGNNLEVKSSLPAPGPIAGPTTVCSGQSGVVYSVTNNPSASFYTWILPSGATGTSLSNSITVDMATATSGLIRVSANNGTCATPTSDLAVTVNTITTWTGGTSAAWHVPANWECGQVPTVNSNVVIPATATNMPTISTADAVARDLTVTAGGVISFASGGVLNLKGNLTLNGANALNTAPSSCGTVVFSDTVAVQTISADDTARFCNLTVANPMNVQLLQHARISGTMHFVRGKFMLHNHNLVMGSGADITGADSTMYIAGRTLPMFGNSFLIRPVGAGPVAFPVGTPTTYNPARLTNSGTMRQMKVRVFPGVFEWATSGTAITSAVVNRTWEIEPIPATGHGVNANITLQWKAAHNQELINFIPDNSYVRKHKGGAFAVWEDVTSSAYVNLGDGVKEITGIGVTNFSKFGVWSNNDALPLSLLEFVGYNINGDGVLYWKTADQVGTSYFEVEKSRDGISFERIGTVNAKDAAVNEYGFTDSYLVSDSYYRLRIVDVDGAYEYSPLVLIRVSGNEEGTFSLFPNPAKQAVTIGYDGALKTGDDLRVRMFTVPGVELLNTTGSIGEVNAALNRRLTTAAAGMYMVQIILNNEITTFKLIKEE